MEVYLLRHGTAEPGSHAASDADRALTPEGCHEVRKVTSAARLAGCTPSLIISSPYKRAQQAAEVAAHVTDYRKPVITSRALAPDSTPEALWNEVRVYRDNGCLLLAGHEPLLSSAAAFFLRSPALAVEFGTAALLRIDVNDFGPEPRGVLKWLLTPRLCV